MDVHCYQTREIWTTGVTDLPHSATDGLTNLLSTLTMAMAETSSTTFQKLYFKLHNFFLHSLRQRIKNIRQRPVIPELCAAALPGATEYLKFSREHTTPDCGRW
jgi:hypothetical protein